MGRAGRASPSEGLTLRKPQAPHSYVVSLPQNHQLHTYKPAVHILLQRKRVMHVIGIILFLIRAVANFYPMQDCAQELSAKQSGVILQCTYEWCGGSTFASISHWPCE